jgi:SAM-dependent methyltransferase
MYLHDAPEPSITVQRVAARQRSERDYHTGYAARNRHLADTPVDMDVCTSDRRRWWTAYWALYDLIRAAPLAGKRVLVPGCGFGEDCLRLAACGARVHGIDLSPEVAAIGRTRGERFAATSPVIRAMPCEQIDYPDGFFDAVVLVNILHHVDIPCTMSEVRRVTKPGALVFGLEMYTHSFAQRLRQSALVTRTIYPRMVRRVYNGDPYITPDERKLDERELDFICGHLEDCRLDYFGILAERLFANTRVGLCKGDRLLAKVLGPLGRYAAGRVVFTGTRKS